MTSDTSIRPAPPRLHFSVAPEPSRLLRARERVRDYVTPYCSDETAINEVVLAVEEACTNAIRHSGSQEEIEIFLAFEGHHLKAAVRDRGCGFDVDAFDADRMPDPLLDHGRGLYLISRLSDEMELRREGGLEVNFLKRSVLQEAMPFDYLDRALVPRSDRTPRHGGRVRAMLDEIDEGFAALDWEYRYTHVNPAACRLLEHDEAETLGRTPSELWPEFSSPQVDGAYRAAMELGRPAIIEYETADHQWFEERIYPTTMGLSVYFRNIDERKHLEEALRDSEEQARLLIRHAPAAIFELDLRSGSFTSVNDYMCDSTGYSREELLRLDPLKLVAEEDRPRYEERIRTMLAGERVSPSVEYRCITREGEERWVVMTSTPTFIQDEPTGVFVVAYDVTEREQDEQARRESARLSEALMAIDPVLHSSLDPGEIMRRALREGGIALDADAAAVLAHESGRFIVRFVWNWPETTLGTIAPDERVGHGVLALQGRQLVAIDDAATDPRVADAPLDELGIGSIVAAPLIVEDEAIAVLVFSYAAPHHFTEAEMDFVSRLGSSLSLALQNARIHEERLHSVRLAEALNAIGIAIGAATDVDSIVQIVAGGGRDAIGCEGAVAVLAEGEQFAIRAALGVAEPLRGLRFERRESPIGVTDLPRDPFVSNDAPGDPRLVPGFAARFGLKTLLFVPFLARAATLGVLAFGNLSQATPFSDDQVRFASALATSAALAIENTRAYEAEHRTAETLRELLALPVPEIEGLRIGVAHRAAAAAERVGGDFYDVFAVDERTVAVFIADVSGKGARAAGYTETIRSAVRTLAYLDSSPAFVLAHTNRSLMTQENDGLFATAALFVIDTGTGVVRYSSAGHPPGVVCGQDRRVLPTEAGVPLGTFEASYSEQTLCLGAGDVLLAYTDGITESRRGVELLGEQRMLAALAELTGCEPQRLVDGLMATAADFAGGELTDDAAVVAVSLRPQAASP